MGRAVSPRSALGKALEELRRGTDFAARREIDPVGIVHRYRRPLDQEIVGLLAASLAFGNVRALRASIENALDRLGPEPARAVTGSSFAQLLERLDGFVHRTVRGYDLARMLHGAGAMIIDHGSIGSALQTQLAMHGQLRPALSGIVAQIRQAAGAPARARSGAGHPAELLADPEAGSACKRLLLYLRWMIRPADGVDLGLWSVPTRILLVPLDTHVHRIAQNLGFTRRTDLSWCTAEEVTEALRAFDPDDPVGYDFALCHLGISKACPSRRDPRKCRGCGLRKHCIQWK